MPSYIHSIHVPSPLATWNLYFLVLEGMCVLPDGPAAVCTNLETFALIEIFFLDFTLSGWLSSERSAVEVGFKKLPGHIPLQFFFYYMWFYTYFYFALFQKWD